MIKKKLLCAFLFVFLPYLSVLSHAAEVKFSDVEKVAKRFMQYSFGRRDSINDVVTFASKQFLSMYAFNFKEGGYVLVSNSDKADPILAYSDNGRFPNRDSIVDDILLIFLESCEAEMEARELKKTGVLKSAGVEETVSKWNEWKSSKINTPSYGDLELVSEVSDLLFDVERGGSVVWSQDGCVGERFRLDKETNEYVSVNNPNHISYNAKTPSLDGCEHSVVGCVPLALSQVMWKWKWPKTMSCVYNNEEYSSVYDWDNMPTKLSVSSTISQMNEISTLLRDCGFILNAKFGCSLTGAYLEDIYDKVVKGNNEIKYNCYEPIFTELYSNRYIRDAEDTYPLSEWLSLVVTELIAGRPVIAGSGHHSYVISGFKKELDGYYFYVNSGLDEASNRYYNLNFAAGNVIQNIAKSAIIGFSPQKKDANKIDASCISALIDNGKGSLFFNVRNANSYIVKIKYKKRKELGWSLVYGCQYGGEEEVILDRKWGNLNTNKISAVDLWSKETGAIIETTYTNKCDTLVFPTMYEVSFFNNEGEIVTYEGYFENKNDGVLTALDELNQNESVCVFPNPSTGNFELSVKDGNLQYVSVRTSTGQMIYEVCPVDSKTVSIDLTANANGLYFVTVFTQNSKTVQKFIKR